MTGLDVAPPTVTDSVPARPSRPRGRVAAAWIGDAVALLVLAWALWWLSDDDGGMATLALVRFAAFALLATPILARELARAPRSARWLMAAWTVGIVASLTFALDRSEFVRETLTFGVVPFVAGSAARVWRRNWGPIAVLSILLLGFGAYWHRSFLQWWGHTMMGGDATWAPLSWRNQSGVLMVAFGMLFAGIGLWGRRVVGAAGVLAASAALAGAWLSSSRAAATLAVVAGVGITALATGLRRSQWRAVLARGVAMAGGAALIVAALLGMIQPTSSSGGSPLANRESSASGNFLLRFEHMEAAAGMLWERPLTGTGLGSYRTVAIAHTDPDSILTASAHNEYLEAFAEGGVIFGTAMLAAVLLAAAGLLRRLRVRRWVDSDDDLRAPLVLGAMAALGAIGVHAATDFDWGYPVLLFLFAVAAVIITSGSMQRDAPTVGRRWALAALAALPLLAGVAGGTIEIRAAGGGEELSAAEVVDVAAPWDTERRRDLAQMLANDGQFDAAAATLDRALTWSPGDSRLVVDRARVRFLAGEIDARQLVAALPSYPTWSANHLHVAETLANAREWAAAEEVANEVLHAYGTYAGWGMDSVAVEVWALRLQAQAALNGCDAARRLANEAARHPAVVQLGAGPQLRTIAAACGT